MSESLLGLVPNRPSYLAFAAGQSQTISKTMSFREGQSGAPGCDGQGARAARRLSGVLQCLGFRAAGSRTATYRPRQLATSSSARFPAPLEPSATRRLPVAAAVPLQG